MRLIQKGLYSLLNIKNMVSQLSFQCIMITLCLKSVLQSFGDKKDSDNRCDLKLLFHSYIAQILLMVCRRQRGFQITNMTLVFNARVEYTLNGKKACNITLFDGGDHIRHLV